MHDVAVREAKAVATATGVYTVQCTEATAGSNTAEATRMAVLAKQFRLRQASASTRFADLFNTRRAAIIAATGSHVQEAYAVSFPARASAVVAGRAESMLACSRYFKDVSKAEDYMYECVEKQYKALRVPNGEYSTLCADGRTSGDAENARVAAMAAQFRGGQLSGIQKAQGRYNASLEACANGRGCSYEEEVYVNYPKVAGAIRWGDGTYAAAVKGPGAFLVNSLPSVTDQINGINLDAYWPNNEIRPAIKRVVEPWNKVPVKQFAPAMSEAAVAYGISFITNPFVDSEYEKWSAGWKPQGKFGLRQ